MDCGLVPPSDWGVGLFCENNAGFVENYQVGGHTIRNEVNNVSLGNMASTRVMRRADLMGRELIATAKQDGERTKVISYGTKDKALVSGIFGDLFNGIREQLNFTFSLKPPPDGKWGGRDPSTQSGWNGMVGLIADGKADITLASLTVTEGRAEVVDFTVGYNVIEKRFFMGKMSDETFNYSLFLMPFAMETWLVLMAVIIITGTLLYISIKLARDSQKTGFKLSSCLTFAFSGLTFIRRFSITPTTISSRIVFITILVSGILVNGMWKASFTSALSVKKTTVLYESLNDLLNAGVLPIVQRSSAQEENFRFAKTGPFKEAWKKMEHKENSFWTERYDAFEKIIADDRLALFDFPIIVEPMEMFLNCKIVAIPGKYFKGQWAMPVRKDFEFYELLNIMILKMKEGGIQFDIFKKYRDKQGGVPDCSKRDKGSALGIKSVISAASVQVLGIILSIIILFVEIAWDHMKRVKIDSNQVPERLNTSTWLQTLF